MALWGCFGLLVKDTRRTYGSIEVPSPNLHRARYDDPVRALVCEEEVEDQVYPEEQVHSQEQDPLRVAWTMHGVSSILSDPELHETEVERKIGRGVDEEDCDNDAPTGLEL